MTDEQPTDRDVLNVAAAIDNFIIDGALEDALRINPKTRQEQINELAVEKIHETGTPKEIATADFLLASYRLFGVDA
ncbi:hypothetical protein ACWDWT_30645 [Streptomyces sp. NPDC003343]